MTTIPILLLVESFDKISLKILNDFLVQIFCVFKKCGFIERFTTYEFAGIIVAKMPELNSHGVILREAKELTFLFS